MRGYDRFVAGDDESGDEVGEEEDDGWKRRAWRGEGLDLMWFGGCDHAQVFERPREWQRLVEVVRAYAAGVDQ